MRDFQRSRVYETEFSLREIYDQAGEGQPATFPCGDSTLTLPPEARFADVPSMQRYVDKASALVGVPSPTVRARRGDSCAHYQAGTIAIPADRNRWAMREIVLLHELAHHVTDVTSRGHDLPGHGREFVTWFLTLLEVTMGPETALVYRILAHGNGVKQ